MKKLKRKLFDITADILKLRNEKFNIELALLSARTNAEKLYLQNKLFDIGFKIQRLKFERNLIETKLREEV